MARVSKNLSLEESAIGRGERYSELHQTNLSRLVSDFLSRLPLPEPTRHLSPIVSRLLGVAASVETNTARPAEEAQASYREHLWTKYGRA